MWQEVVLSDLFEVRSSKRVLKSQWQTEGVPFYRGREITKLSEQGYVDNDLFISEELFAELSDKHGVPTEGDIVITAIGTIGNSHVVTSDDRFYFKDASVLWLKKQAGLDSQYVNYWLKSSLMKKQLDVGNGATVDTLTIQKLKSLRIAIPPLDEQKRIVAILDQALEGIDKAIANTEQNLKNARELFDSYLSKMFSEGSSSWAKDELLNLVDQTCSLSYGIVQPGNDFPNGLPVVRPTDLGEPVIRRNGLKLIDPQNAASYKRTTLQGNDLLLCVRGSTGDVSMADPELSGANVTRGLVPIRFEKHKILQKFGYYAFLAKPLRDQIKAKTYGAALMQINIRDVKKLELAFPPLQQQRDIVNRLDRAHGAAARLLDTQEKKLLALHSLKQALLQKAFSGELPAASAQEAVKVA